jgi:hypothetical protein
MRTSDELNNEFNALSSVGTERREWVDNLSLNELKIMRDIFEKALPWRAEGTWLFYAEKLINIKTVEQRDDKINELGI